jgi:hypothetical protein
MLTDERELINRMASGLCEGVQQHDSAWFAPLCISVTGVRWNEGAGYHEYRDAAIWLSPNMQSRVIGLPILAGADPGPMNSNEFGKRCIGTIVSAYTKDSALWAVARIANDSALRVIESGNFDSRLTAHFDNAAASIDLDDGKLIVEPMPRYLSHVSIVPKDSVEFEYGFVIVHKSEQGNLINARP